MTEKNDEYILIVEDDASIRFTVQELLESEGYHVLSSENGKVALNILKENKFKIALILLDWMMPVMDGNEFLKEVKKDPSHCFSSIPVILLTASVNITEEAKNTVDGFIKKPIELESFLKIIDHVYSKKAA